MSDPQRELESGEKKVAEAASTVLWMLIFSALDSEVKRLPPPPKHRRLKLAAKHFKRMAGMASKRILPHPRKG